MTSARANTGYGSAQARVARDGRSRVERSLSALLLIVPGVILAVMWIVATPAYVIWNLLKRYTREGDTKKGFKLGETL